MFNQSFNFDNLLKIIYSMNNKGYNIELRYFPNLRDDIENLKKQNDLIKINIGNKNKLKELYENKYNIKEEKDKKLKDSLIEISKKISHNNYRIEIEKRNQINNKQIYSLRDNIENLFISKQLQYNLYKLYKIKQSNRQIICEQVKNILEDGFPKYIIKTDIKDCYETVNQKKLKEKLFRDNLLSDKSKKYINNILSEFNKLLISDGKEPTGLPRGIGISAYLAEIYLRQVDRIIKKLDNIIYYARYVDDIIIIILPEVNNYPNKSYIGDIKKKLEREIKDETDLILNANKTKDGNQDNFNFDYLGYNYKWDNNKLKVNLSKNKFDKYKKKIKVSFENYTNYKKYDEKASRNLLVKRIRYLTGNSRIVSYNKYFLTGINYSCPLINEFSLIKSLDDLLISEIHKLRNPIIARRLSKYNFELGFIEKRFSPFIYKELRDIVKVWKGL